MPNRAKRRGSIASSTPSSNGTITNARSATEPPMTTTSEATPTGANRRAISATTAAKVKAVP